MVQGHYNYTSNISTTVHGMQRYWVDTRSVDRISCSMMCFASGRMIGFPCGVVTVWRLQIG